MLDPLPPPERKPFRDNGWDRRRLRGPGLCTQHPWGQASSRWGVGAVLVEAGVGAAGAVSPLAALHHAGDLQAGHHRKTAVPDLRREREREHHRHPECCAQAPPVPSMFAQPLPTRADGDGGGVRALLLLTMKAGITGCWNFVLKVCISCLVLAL